jgi:hypothetical protein
VAFVEVIETVGKVIDATGVAVIVGGALVRVLSIRVCDGTDWISLY